jgi:hypothetical protein
MLKPLNQRIKTMAKYEDEGKWGKDEAQKIDKGNADNQARGSTKNTKSFLQGWSARAAQNSYDPFGRQGKAQARRDLSSAGASRDVRLGDSEGHPNKIGGENENTKQWRHFSEVSRRNSYTGKGGSRRD